MIDYVNPLKCNYTVIDFRNKAVPIVSFSMFKVLETALAVGVKWSSERQ